MPFKELSTHYKRIFLSTILLTVAVASYLAIGVDKDIIDLNWEDSAHRGWHKMPSDNNLQYDTARVFIRNKPPWLWENNSWTMGDRPPLLGVIVAFVGKIIGNRMNYLMFQAIAIVMNSLFLLPLMLVLSRMFKPKILLLVFLALALHRFLFLNMYFAWPKLLGIYFMFCAVNIILSDYKSPRNAFFAGVLAGCGVLAHAVVALSLPMLCLLYFLCLVYKNRGRRLVLRPLPVIVFCVAFVITIQPWSVYKKNHSEILTNKCLFLAYYPSKEFSSTLHTPAVMKKEINSFLRETKGTQLSTRFNNIKQLFNNNYSLLFSSIRKLKHKEYFEQRHASAFFYKISNVGEIPLLLFCFAVIFFIAELFKARKEGFVQDRILFFRIASLVMAVVLSYAVMSFCKWTKPINHELPYFELIILLSVIYGYIFYKNIFLRIVLMLWVGVDFIHFLSNTYLRKNVDFWSISNLLFIGCITIIILLATWRQKSEAVTEC